MYDNSWDLAVIFWSAGKLTSQQQEAGRWASWKLDRVELLSMFGGWLPRWLPSWSQTVSLWKFASYKSQNQRDTKNTNRNVSLLPCLGANDSKVNTTAVVDPSVPVTISSRNYSNLFKWSQKNRNSKKCGTSVDESLKWKVWANHLSVWKSPAG